MFRLDLAPSLFEKKFSDDTTFHDPPVCHKYETKTVSKFEANYFFCQLRDPRDLVFI